MNLHIYFDIGQNLLVIGLILHCQKKKEKKMISIQAINVINHTFSIIFSICSECISSLFILKR